MRWFILVVPLLLDPAAVLLFCSWPRSGARSLPEIRVWRNNQTNKAVGTVPLHRPEIAARKLIEADGFFSP